VKICCTLIVKRTLYSRSNCGLRFGKVVCGRVQSLAFFGQLFAGVFPNEVQGFVKQLEFLTKTGSYSPINRRQ